MCKALKIWSAGRPSGFRYVYVVRLLGEKSRKLTPLSSMTFGMGGGDVAISELVDVDA